MSSATNGNPDCHLVLRGGNQPNFDAASVAAAQAMLTEAGLATTVMVDCSHANSEKDPERQVDVANNVCTQRTQGNADLRALMIESHLIGGRQDIGGELTYGQSITDGCLGFEATRALMHELASQLA